MKEQIKINDFSLLITIVSFIFALPKIKARDGGLNKKKNK
jgi:hypothetical protein